MNVFVWLIFVFVLLIRCCFFYFVFRCCGCYIFDFLFCGLDYLDYDDLECLDIQLICFWFIIMVEDNDRVLCQLFFIICIKFLVVFQLNGMFVEYVCEFVEVMVFVFKYYFFGYWERSDELVFVVCIVVQRFS